MWRQAATQNMVPKPITQYGWEVQESRLSIVRDSRENVQAICQRVSVLLHGCKCATGCVSGRCSCKRKGKLCSEGCQCLNCTNITTVNDIETDITELVVEENAVDSDVDKVMDWVFGEKVLI